MDLDYDVLITVAGKDVADDWMSIRIHPSEESMTSITLTVRNDNLKNCGLASKRDPIAVRIGRNGSWSDPVELPIKKIDQKGRDATITYTAQDDQEKLCGGRSRGMFKEGMTPREIQREIGEAYGIQIEGDSDGPRLKKTKFPVCNENARDVYYATQRMQKSKTSGKAPGETMSNAGGQKPASFKGKEWDSGHQASATGCHPLKSKDGKELDENEASNNANAASGEQNSGSIELRGCPWLQAHGCIDVLGVGSRFSGTYYVKELEHSADRGSPFMTSAQLIRGGSGKGGAGGKAPIVQYADIYQKGKIYIGPRKLDSPSQGTFVWGRDEWFVDYQFSEAEQSRRGGGESGGGGAKGINFRKKGEVVDVKADTGDGEGGGE